MSGIVGVINRGDQPVVAGELKQLVRGMARIGPDESGTWIEKNIGLGCASFSADTGQLPDHQPGCMDGACIVADARVDDKDNLLRKLRSAGRRVNHAVTDSQLILHAYHAWSEQCTEHLYGDFAFAIWDTNKQRLFCARDHFGVKPFYYASTPGTLIFCTSFNEVRRYISADRVSNDQAVLDFLIFGANHDPQSTTSKSIQRLPAASILTLDRGQELHITKYWSPSVGSTIRYANEQEYVEHFDSLFTQAVADRTRNGPVSVLLSGGMDSSSVTGVAREILGRQGYADRIATVTMTSGALFPDDEEGDLAARLSGHLGFRNTQVTLDDYKIFAGWEKLYRYFPQPHFSLAPGQELEMYESLGRESRVCLTGEGGDPGMLGSGVYCINLVREMGVLRGLASLSRAVVSGRSLRGLGLGQLGARLTGKPLVNLPDIPPWINRGLVRQYGYRERRAYLLNRNRAACADNRACVSLSNAIWQHYFENSYSTAVRQMEVRHPFFDVRLVEYLLSLPPLRFMTHKGLLRAAMQDRLPDFIRTRPKQAFRGDLIRQRIPHAGWIDQNKALHSDAMAGFIDTERYLADWKRYLNGGGHPSYHMITPLSLACWLSAGF